MDNKPRTPSPIYHSNICYICNNDQEEYLGELLTISCQNCEGTLIHEQCLLQWSASQITPLHCLNCHNSFLDVPPQYQNHSLVPRIYSTEYRPSDSTNFCNILPCVVSATLSGALIYILLSLALSHT